MGHEEHSIMGQRVKVPPPEGWRRLWRERPVSERTGAWWRLCGWVFSHVWRWQTRSFIWTLQAVTTTFSTLSRGATFGQKTKERPKKDQRQIKRGIYNPQRVWVYLQTVHNGQFLALIGPVLTPWAGRAPPPPVPDLRGASGCASLPTERNGVWLGWNLPAAA